MIALLNSCLKKEKKKKKLSIKGTRDFSKGIIKCKGTISFWNIESPVFPNNS